MEHEEARLREEQLQQFNQQRLAQPNSYSQGYKDGLKMEDYRMNGPRLLSVNGLSVDDDGQNEERYHGSVEETPLTTQTKSSGVADGPLKISAQDPRSVGSGLPI